MIGGLSASGSSTAVKGSTPRRVRSSPRAFARRFRAHCVSPRGATRYFVPSRSSTFTGTVRHSPLFRPRTASVGTSLSVISSGLSRRATTNPGFR